MTNLDLNCLNKEKLQTYTLIEHVIDRFTRNISQYSFNNIIKL